MVQGGKRGRDTRVGKGWGESRWRRVIRYRLSNEMRDGNYWKSEEEKVCRLCEGEIETWERV